jgi:hypothetical protein
MTAKTAATPDNAVLLLGAASTLGLDKQVVQMKFGNLTAPAEVFEEAGFTIDEESGFATLDTEEKPAASKKVKATEVDDPEPAKAPARKTATKKTAAQAEKE